MITHGTTCTILSIVATNAEPCLYIKTRVFAVTPGECFQVGSRRVIQAGGIIMIVLGCLGKFGALFVTIPTPVVGGMFMVTFGKI